MTLRLRSENIGGLVSMAGSSVFLLGGDRQGLAVLVCFLIAEALLARAGHRRWGHASACLSFALGDALATTSELAAGNAMFQLTLWAMAAVWSLGAARAPLAWLGERLEKPALVQTADRLQPISAGAVLGLRLPGLAAALLGGSCLAAVAVALWALSDVLVGRLQDVVGQFVRSRVSVLSRGPPRTDRRPSRMQ